MSCYQILLHLLCSLLTLIAEYSCPDNSTYQPVMSLDISTCQNPDALYGISSGVGEGCQCNEGFVSDGVKCLPREDCGCIYGEDEIYLEVRRFRFVSV